MTEFTEGQKKALATATLHAKTKAPGFIVEAHRVADRMVCDGLVKSGHLTAVEGVDGGYTLSDEMLAANAITVARQAEQAKQN
jgi:DNA-binding IscR family transcriptional regulator